MAFSGTYWKATKQVASTDNLTDFSFIVADLPTAFFTACTSNDGTKLRCAKDDGVTELAFDPIEFDTTTETIILRVKWSGTVTPTGTYTLRIYPALTENVSYGVNDTYGQYNAYNSNWLGYYPLQSDANDRTGNNNGIAQGGVTIGDSFGKVGNATSFDGVDDWIQLDPIFSSGATDFELDLWYKGIDDVSQYFGQGLTTSSSPRLLFMHQFAFTVVGSGGISISTSDDIDNTWRYLGFNPTDLHIDSESVQAGTVAIPTGTYDNAGIGSFNRGGSLYQPTEGLIQDVKAFDSARTDAERAEEYAQFNDNATFWGTWTEVSAGQDYQLSLDTGIFTFTGNDIDLLYGRAISLDPGNFNLIGNDISLLKDSSIIFESGVFNLIGNDASLLIDRAIETETGSFTLTGNDIELIYGLGYVLNLEAGGFALSGIDIDLFKDSSIDLESGEFNLNGKGIQLLYSGTSIINKAYLSGISKRPIIDSLSKKPKITGVGH